MGKWVWYDPREVSPALSVDYWGGWEESEAVVFLEELFPICSNKEVL